MKIFARVTEKGPIVEKAEAQAFSGVFKRLMDVIKVIFKYSKEPENDGVFKEEGIIDVLLMIVRTFYIQNYDLILNLTKNTVNNKQIS